MSDENEMSSESVLVVILLLTAFVGIMCVVYLSPERDSYFDYNYEMINSKTRIETVVLNGRSTYRLQLYLCGDSCYWSTTYNTTNKESIYEILESEKKQESKSEINYSY